MIKTYLKQGFKVGDLVQGKAQYTGAKGYVYGLQDGMGQPVVDVQWTSGLTGATRFLPGDVDQLLELQTTDPVITPPSGFTISTPLIILALVILIFGLKK